MSTIEEIKVPDIGDFKGVPIIEVMVKPGDTIEQETPLIVLESDKASMEVPSPRAGKVQEIRVKVGDKVSQGDPILLLEVAQESAPAQPKPALDSTPASAMHTPASTASAYSGGEDLQTEVLVLGAGPGGYSAVFRAADLGKQTVLVERYPTLGGVCLNVGCIPSKALLHVAKIIDETREFARHGLKFSPPEIDLDAVRDWKDGVVNRLTGGLAGMARQRKVQVVTGVGQFLDPHHLEVTDKDGQRRVIRFEQAIIAAGSQPVKLPFIPDDPRIMDSTGALELPDIPKRLLVLGGGIIGLEMATVYHALGSQITVVEMLDGLMPGADRDLIRPFQKRIEQRYEKIMLKTKVTRVEALPEGLRVTFEGENAPSEPERFDRILVAVGRVPNGNKIGADKAGVMVNERGFIAVDKQLRTSVPQIYAIGDIVGQPLLAHKAMHEGHVAAEACAGMKAYFDARVIPSVAYTDPEVAWAGLTEIEAKGQGINYGKSVFPWSASGRSLAMGRDEGMTKILFDEETDRIIGMGIVGPQAGDLISEGALAIEMGCDAVDIGRTIHPHPTLSESIGLAAEAFEGTITDLYLPQKKK
ncbi:MAG: dihydrolipoyl dehydrogenase [Candidatus Competibacteraceae bacterium]